MEQVEKFLILLLVVHTAKNSFAGSGNYKNEENLGDVIKNQSISNENNSTSSMNNDDDDILRKEAKTFLKECGVEIGSGENFNKDNHDRKGKRNYDIDRNRQNNGKFESNESSDWDENNNRKHTSHSYNRQMFNGKYKKSNNKSNNNYNHKSNNKKSKHNHNSNDEKDEINEENEDSNETEEDYDSSDKKYNREYGKKRNNNKDDNDDDDGNEGSSFHYQRNDKNKSNRNNFFDSYGGFSSNKNKNNNDDDSRNNSDNNHSYGNYHSNSYSSSGYGSNNRNHGNYGSYDNNDQACSSDRNKNNQYDGYDYYNNRGNGYDSRGIGSYNTNYDRRYSSYIQGKSRGNERDSIFRTKRYTDTNEEQCISQCVFGYLEVLDNNRVPSETLLIKWLQDHLRNDMKRIKSLRESRRCFGRLSVMDAKDGCEFSKSLSNCLKLELE